MKKLATRITLGATVGAETPTKSACRLPMLEKLKNHREHGDQNNSDQHELKVLFDEGNIAKEITRRHAQPDPKDSPRNGKEQEASVGHRAGTRVSG